MGVEADEFEARYRAHVDAVWRYARRRCDDATHADDATAEAFAIAWRRRDELPEGDALRLWLLGTVRRVLANDHRGDRRRANLRAKLEAAPPPRPADDPADEATTSPALWEALAALSPVDRDLLLMRAWDGLAVTDIAALLGCTPNAASIRLTRARDRLAQALAATDPAPVRTSIGRDPEAGGGIR